MRAGPVAPDGAARIHGEDAFHFNELTGGRADENRAETPAHRHIAC
jgi:hypothetical protein